MHRADRAWAAWRGGCRVLDPMRMAALGALLALSTQVGVAGERPAAPKTGWPQRLTVAIVPYQVPPQSFDVWTPVADFLQDP